MESQTSKTLIYQSIGHETTCAEHDLFREAHLKEIFYEPFMPSDRSRDVAWGITTLVEDRYPDLSIPYINTFAETTDLRAQELIGVVDNKDLPIVVYWSGGIDSTVILSALIKNWPKHLLDRVLVKMNRASYFENPWFFDKVITKNNLKIQDLIGDWQDYFILTGSCADSLWVQADVVELEILWPGSSKWSMVSKKDSLIQWISSKSREEIAHKMYDMVVESSQRVGVELDTFEDFYWWWNFNFVYTGQLYKYLDDYCSAQSRIDLSLWRQQHLGWYHTDSYQSWSAWNRSNGIKINKTVRSYKWPAKQYIFELDGNHWYRDYKTKIGSGGHKTGNFRRIKGLYSDGTLLI